MRAGALILAMLAMTEPVAPVDRITDSGSGAVAFLPG
jgi:hypothetical protein